MPPVPFPEDVRSLDESLRENTDPAVRSFFALELLNRRIRSPEDLSLALDLPVLAVLEPEVRPGNWRSKLSGLITNRRPKTA